MPRIRTGTSTRVITAIAIFVLLLVAEIAAFVFGNIPLDASSLGPMALITFIVGISVVFVIVLYARLERSFNAAVRGDDNITPPVVAQPDPQQALAAGESLTLHRTATVGGIMRPLVVFGIFFLLLLVLYEGLLGIFLPALPWSSLWSPGQSSLPAWLQWAIAGLVLFLFVVGIVSLLIAIVRDTNYTLVADDSGLTIRARWQRTQQIPWDDILVFMRVSVYSGDHDLSSFRLFGTRHRAVLAIQPALSLMQGSGTLFSVPQRLYHFDGGLDDYRSQAQRLLGTISARSHVALRAFPQGYYGRWNRVVYPLLGLTYQDVQRMPIADTAQQPTPVALLEAQHFSGKLALRRTVRGRALLRVALIVTPFLLILTVINILVALPKQPVHPAHSVTHYLLVYFLLLIFVLIIELPLAVVFYAYQIIPKVRANDAGVRIQGTSFGQRATIPWEQIQAWGMMPATAKQRDVTYAVFWSGRTISWQEPTHWRRPADQTTAEQLHALITARTHLPLHVIPPHL